MRTNPSLPVPRAALWAGLAWSLYLSCPLAGSASVVSLETLLDEMVDRAALARWPDPPYTCRQASSYDRATVAPDRPGWFANMDRSFFIRQEPRDGQTEYVLMDVEGPGAVVRFWATWHGPGGKNFSNGKLRFYLDGAPSPAIEGAISEILDGGGLVEGPLSQGVSPRTPYEQRGHNLYLPIPYAKRCKITYTTDAPIDPGAHKGEALYYQINYRSYPPGTPVRTFDRGQLEALRAKLDSVQRRLLASGVQPQPDWQVHQASGPLLPGETRVLELKQPGAIRQLTLQLEAEDPEQALRSTILEIEFDGRRTVWCPVGEFFGRGYRSAPHRTWYTEVTPAGEMSCFWVMPCQQSAVLRLRNLRRQNIQVRQFRVVTSPWSWDDRSMYFHATWHQLTKAPSFRAGATQPGEGAYDVNFVTIQGRGVYAGDTLTVFNGTDAWWGEGDEKIYVDGETFPSHIGTGTEDYYGYAWCRPEFFEAPFHAQPIGEGNFHPGLTVNCRYRSLDAIPFQRSLRFDMELWHWRKTRLNYAPTTFWYARPGARWNIDPDPTTAALPVARQRTDVVEIVRVPGALEGEELRLVGKTGGETEVQIIDGIGWSNDAQLWWKFGKPGDQLVLEFPVASAGRYEVLAGLTKAPDYARVRLEIAGKPAGEFDRYHPGVAHDLLSLGIHELAAGSQTLTITLVGHHPKAEPKGMFGLDYLKLVPQQP
ncbi:MAG: glycoside hydrolase family 172 protein [Limisphaera sp.]